MMRTPALSRLAVGCLCAAGSAFLASSPRVQTALFGVQLAAAQDREATAIEPFTIDVAEEALVDLRERLARARFPDEPEGAGWILGTNGAYLRELVTYWRDEFDWREHEARLNELEQFTTNIGGLDIHFVHRRSVEPNALPLILTHGWPGTFAEFVKVIGPLTDPVAHGGRAEDAFHVGIA